MTSSQSPSFYRENGYSAPHKVLDLRETDTALDNFLALEAMSHGRIKPLWNLKIHLLVPWIWSLVHDDRVTAPVKAILGENLLCWGAGFFVKSPGDCQYVSMHQDFYYWNLTEPKGLTAWIALTPSCKANGCLEIIPKSHKQLLPHSNKPERSNMLPAAEHVQQDDGLESALPIELHPGEMSLHHCQTIHGSQPAKDGGRRIGLTIRYIDSRVSQTGKHRGSATLISGPDQRTFDLESPPRGLLNCDDLDVYADLSRRFFSVAFKPSDEGGYG